VRLIGKIIETLKEENYYLFFLFFLTEVMYITGGNIEEEGLDGGVGEGRGWRRRQRG